MDRIYKTNKGACHGYINRQEPGSVKEYGERYSCYYNNGVNGHEDFHFIFLGWNQGSDEHWGDESKEARRQSMEFIEREFSSPRSQNATWRFCIQHMTSAKLSAGDRLRDSMELSGITDACRRHGALLINGHHHLYSRTKLLRNVGGPDGTENITVANGPKNYVKINTTTALVVREGVTMSITTGMGGYDSSCNGKYADASWMKLCVASFEDHRGAVIAEFDEAKPWIGKFQYLNSLAQGAVVDEFVLTSRLPGWNITHDQPTIVDSPSQGPTSVINIDDQSKMIELPAQGTAGTAAPSTTPVVISASNLSSSGTRKWDTPRHSMGSWTRIFSNSLALLYIVLSSY